MKIDSKLIEKEITKWREILKIDPQWTVRYQIRTNIDEMSDGHADSLACIDVDLRYFEAVIEFNVSVIDGCEYDLDSIVLHELLHILIAPLSSCAACGLGKKFEEMNDILTEGTIERLMPGYLALYKKAYRKKKKTTKV